MRLATILTPDGSERAAEHATGRFALGEMVSHLHKALRQRATLPDTPETLRRELSLQIPVHP